MKTKKDSPVIVTKCPRCNKNTKHMVLISGKKKTYKCLICKTIH